MSGAKGKSGLKKGQTNNPNGRPKGAKNNIDEGAFKTYYNGLLSEAELNSLKSKCFFNVT